MVKVMQCWDDGTIGDARLTEILRKYNAKATFNLNPDYHGETRGEQRWVGINEPGWSFKGFRDGKLGKNELREIYGGFQVASHCMKHECAGAVPDDVFIKSALDARHYLEDLFGQSCPGFAWPCGRYTQETADALLEAGFAYGRTTQNAERISECEHPMILHSSCHFHDGQFYQKYENAKAGDGLFYFWGHTFENMDSEGLWNQLEMKIKYISEDPDATWVNLCDIDWKNAIASTKA